MGPRQVEANTALPVEGEWLPLGHQAMPEMEFDMCSQRYMVKVILSQTPPQCVMQ